MNHLNVPVLLTGFNRADFFIQSLISLRELGLKQIFIALDGPRPNHEHDIAESEKIRKFLHETKSWSINMEYLVRKENLGCRYAMQEAITWFFEHVEAGIILEDDCTFHPDFIPFASEMLERFSDNPEIMHISGSNFQKGQRFGNESYYFSAMPHIWGWATWRRAWKRYDENIDLKVLDQLEGYFNNKKDINRFKREFSKAISGKLDTWGYRWINSIWKHKGLCITPSVNLITNIGFGENATHTKQEKSSLNKMPIRSLDMPFVHPHEQEINYKADNLLYKKHYKPKINYRYIKYKLLLPFIQMNLPGLYKKLELWNRKVKGRGE